MNYGLGRIYLPDERDYAWRTIKPSAIATTNKSWFANGWWGNQGSKPHCVGYAWVAALEDGPTTHDPRGPNTTPLIDPDRLYREAQDNDQWEGHDYEGTSIRGGAKALQKLGLITEYRWALTIDEVIAQLLEVGPLVCGTVWYSAMFEPDPKTNMLDVRGEIVGGHAYVANGCNLNSGTIRIKNSWGREWGHKGHARIRIEDFEQLLLAHGEACSAIEVAL